MYDLDDPVGLGQSAGWGERVSPGGEAQAPDRGTASRSSLREARPSFENTLRKCHSTVRGLMNNSAPISGFVRPSPASRVISASCGVRSSRASSVRLRTVPPVANSSRRARSAKAAAPIVVSISWAIRSWPRASTRRC